MSEAAQPGNRDRRRASAHNATRSAILHAARQVGAREGAKHLSLRGVAAEAGFAPAALYGYFRNKDELLLALAADDLTVLARAMREAAGKADGSGRLGAAAAAALSLMEQTETIATAPSALTPGGPTSDAERLFNGRLIAALKVLSEAAGHGGQSRSQQADIVLIAAAVAGLAMLSRSGRLSALGFTPEEVVARLDAHFAQQNAA